MAAPKTVKEACDYLKCSRSKLNKYINQGMPIIQPGGKKTKILIDVDDVMEWLKKQ